MYENATEFQEKHHLWTTDRVGTHEPEVIDTETQQFFRNIYKLEKQFADQPAPRTLAQTVSKYCFILSFNLRY